MIITFQIQTWWQLAAISHKLIQFISPFRSFPWFSSLLGQLFDLPPVSLSHQVLVNESATWMSLWNHHGKSHSIMSTMAVSSHHYCFFYHGCHMMWHEKPWASRTCHRFLKAGPVQPSHRMDRMYRSQSYRGSKQISIPLGQESYQRTSHVWFHFLSFVGL